MQRVRERGREVVRLHDLSARGMHGLHVHAARVRGGEHARELPAEIELRDGMLVSVVCAGKRTYGILHS